MPSSTPGATLIQARDLCAGYAGRQVLHDISLDLKAGELVGLLGPNGAGKSTLLLALAGALPLSGGRVELAGSPLSGLSPRQRARRLAMVPQRVEVGFDLAVENLALMGRYAHVPLLGGYGDDDRRVARASLEEAGAGHLRGRSAAGLSGGELARVLLARALCQQAPALLLDETLASLDMAGRAMACGLLRAKAAAGMLVVAAIHDLNLAALLCDRLLFLKGGRLVLDGPTAEVFTAQNLRDIYDTPILVASHPGCGAPQAFLDLGGPGPVPAGDPAARGRAGRC